MKEILFKMLAELEAHFEKKELEVSNNPNFNSHTQSELNNRKNEILNFEFFIKKADISSLQNEIIQDFRKNADRIKLDIDKIKCEIIK